MALSRQRMIDRMMVRDASYDGKFIVGVLSTGIYCLPSCGARKPLVRNVRFFRDPGAARSAGLRACRRCRPDEGLSPIERDLDLLEEILELIDRAPEEIANVGQLAEMFGVGSTKLHELFRVGGRRTPHAELTRARVELAKKRLLGGRNTVTDVAFEAGFESLSTFQSQFLRRVGTTPGAYRRLPGVERWSVRLPASYPSAACLEYFDIHKVAPHLEVSGETLSMAVWAGDIAVRLDIEFLDREARCYVSSPVGLSAEQLATVSPLCHAIALRLLGLESSTQGFGRLLASLDDFPDGLRKTRVRQWGTPDRWTAALWAVAGQQVSLAMIGKMLCELAGRYGAPVGDGLVALPRPSDLSGASIEDLRALKFSQQKAKTLLEFVSRPEFLATFESLDRLSSQRADRVLQSVRGIGPWSAGYILVRGFGFADCWPQGDAPLARAWGQAAATAPPRGRPPKATPEEVEQSMDRLAPYRSLATFQLWNSLKNS